MKLLAEMHELARTRLATLSHEWKVLPQQLVEIAPTAAREVRSAGHGEDPGSRFRVPIQRHQDRGRQ